MTRKLTNAEYEKWQGLEPGDTGQAILPAPSIPSVKDQGASSAPEAPEWVEEERWVPVSELGERWVGRSKAEAEEAMRAYPAGGCYSNGDPWDGVTHIEREIRRVTEWRVVP